MTVLRYAPAIARASIGNANRDAISRNIRRQFRTAILMFFTVSSTGYSTAIAGRDLLRLLFLGGEQRDACYKVVFAGFYQRHALSAAAGFADLVCA